MKSNLWCPDMKIVIILLLGVAYVSAKSEPVGGSDSIRLLEVNIPPHAIHGQDTKLLCNYDVEEDRLYSVKWYHNETEFYRYIPTDTPSTKIFRQPGIDVDDRQSTERIIYLRNVDLSTAGQYRCEVSLEAPRFLTAAREAILIIVEDNCVTNSNCVITTDGIACNPPPADSNGCICKNNKCKLSSGCGTMGPFFFRSCGDCSMEDCEDEGVCRMQVLPRGSICTVPEGDPPQPLPSACVTTENAPCQFPFTYMGFSYDKCTYTDTINNQPWCATVPEVALARNGKVADGRHVGDCDLFSNCEVEDGLPPIENKDYDDQGDYNYDEDDFDYIENEYEEVHNPVILTNPKNIVSEEGSTINLPCHVDKLAGNIAVWYKDSVDNTIAIGRTIVNGDSRVTITEVDMGKDSGSVLLIGASMPEDAGSYVCQIQTEKKPEVMHNVTVVSLPVIENKYYDDQGDYNYDEYDADYIENEYEEVHNPVILTKPKNIVSEEGSTIHLPCHVDKLAGNIVVWYKNSVDNTIAIGRTIVNGDSRATITEVDMGKDSGSVLLIGASMPEDAGSYVCQIQTEKKPEVMHNVTVLSE